METEQEEWRPAFELEDRYEVSSFGRIRHAKTKRIRRTTVSVYGYQRIAVRNPKSGSATTRKIHILVARTFLGLPPPGKPVVHHIDHNKCNNAVANLMYVTERQNYEFAVAAGRYDLSSVHLTNVKLTPDHIYKVRSRQGVMSARATASEFAISVSHVYRIWRRQSWDDKAMAVLTSTDKKAAEI